MTHNNFHPKSESIGATILLVLLKIPVRIVTLMWSALRRFPDLFLTTVVFLSIGTASNLIALDTPSNILGLFVGYFIAMTWGIKNRARRALLATQSAVTAVLDTDSAWRDEKPRVHVTRPQSFQKSTEGTFGGEIK